jgi:hypothetical protein
MILLESLWPILFLAGLFFCVVHLAKYIISRFLEHK